MPGSHRPLRSATLLAAALLAVGLAGCGNSNDTSHTGTHGGGTHRPVTTSDADWTSVTDALGRTGKFGDNNAVYRIPLVRSDLQVVTVGVPIKPGLSLGGYVAFAKYDDTTMVMGDLVVTEAELPRVTDALQSHAIEQTALHKHLLEQSPQVWWTHIHAMGDPAQLAAGIKAALDATAIAPAAAPPAQHPPVDLDTAGIDAALGRKGNPDGGLYTFNLARQDTIVDDGHLVPPTFGVTTTVNFQPLGEGKAAINGDIVMTGPEVQKVIQAIRAGNIALVTVHNHSLTDEPRLFYLHYWAVDDPVTLAKAMRVALDATNLQPAK
jgi:hypothetical protein